MTVKRLYYTPNYKTELYCPSADFVRRLLIKWAEPRRI